MRAALAAHQRAERVGCLRVMAVAPVVPPCLEPGTETAGLVQAVVVNGRRVLPLGAVHDELAAEADPPGACGVLLERALQLCLTHLWRQLA